MLRRRKAPSPMSPTTTAPTPTTAEPHSDLDALDRVLSAQARAALERFRQQAAMHRRAVADLQAVKADLVGAVGSGDREQIAALARARVSASFVLEASPAPDFAREAAGAVRSAVQPVFQRFSAALEARRGQTLEAANRAGLRWSRFHQRYQTWAREGSDAGEGFALLSEASYWCSWLDSFESEYAPTPRPADALAHPAPKPPLPPLIFLGPPSR